MQFTPFQQIRQQEIAAGHDNVLASCVNFASPDEEEDGEALYLGQGQDLGDRCFLCIDRNGLATLVLTNGTVVASNFVPEDRQDLLVSIDWLTSLE